MPDYDTKNPILDPVDPPAEGVTPPVGTFERPDVCAGAKRLEEEPRGTAAVAELLSAVRDRREDFSRVFGASKEVVTERVKGLRDRAGGPPRWTISAAPMPSPGAVERTTGRGRRTAWNRGTRARRWTKAQ